MDVNTDLILFSAKKFVHMLGIDDFNARLIGELSNRRLVTLDYSKDVFDNLFLNKCVLLILKDMIKNYKNLSSVENGSLVFFDGIDFDTGLNLVPLEKELCHNLKSRLIQRKSLLEISPIIEQNLQLKQSPLLVNLLEQQKQFSKRPISFKNSHRLMK